MMNKTLRAHPLMIPGLLAPFLFVLVIPVIKGLIQYLFTRRVSGIIALESVAFAVILAIAIMRWLRFSVTFREEKIIIRCGLIIRRVSVIPVSRISSVTSERNPADFIFGAVTYRINTEGGTVGKPDFEFKLSVRDGQLLSAFLYGADNRIDIKFSLFKIALMAATTSSAMTGMIVGVPIINKAGNLLGFAISDMLLHEINSVSEKINTYFPPIVNVITIIVLISYLFSFFFSLLRYVSFRLSLSKDKITVSSGFFVKHHAVFRKNSVNNVFIEQTPLMRLFRRYSMRVAVGGYSRSKNDRAVIIPCGSRDEMSEQLTAIFPNLLPDGSFIKPARNRDMRFRFFFMPIISAVVCVVITLLLVRLLPFFDRLIIFLCLVALGIICYFADLSLYNYRDGTVRFGDRVIYAKSTRIMSFCELHCEKERVGVIKITRVPADYFTRTCRVRITMRSESAESLCVRNLDYIHVRDNVCGMFVIDPDEVFGKNKIKNI